MTNTTIKIMRKILLFVILFAIASFALAQSNGKVLMNKEIEVPRGDSKEFHFLIPEGRKMQFKGNFKTTGGMNDDINLIVLNQQNYVRWLSHYDYDSLLRIERKKEGKFTVNVEPGETYYFVFDNFFSTVSNKKVKVRIELLPLN